MISKMFVATLAGGLKELFTDADVFRCTFPLDLSVTTKACLLGAAILIVSLYNMIYLLYICYYIYYSYTYLMVSSTLILES